MAIDFNGTPGDYSYSQDAHGKSAEGIVAVGAQSARDPGAQRAAGGADRQAGDHGGHLIAHSLGGKNEPCNLDAQAANVNQIDQRGVERNLADLANNPSNTVYVGVHNFNSNGSQRPDATMITGAVKDSNGNIDIQHSSFQNASHQDQQSWNDTVNQDTYIDGRQDAGMSAEERDLANELCGAEAEVDMSLGTCTNTSFESGTQNTAADPVQTDTAAEGAQDDGLVIAPDSSPETSQELEGADENGGSMECVGDPNYSDDSPVGVEGFSAVDAAPADGFDSSVFDSGMESGTDSSFDSSADNGADSGFSDSFGSSDSAGSDRDSSSNGGSDGDGMGK